MDLLNFELKDLTIEDETVNKVQPTPLQYSALYYRDLKLINDRYIHIIEGVPVFLKETTLKDPLAISVQEYHRKKLKYIQID